MPDYGHPLRFGSFITPVNVPAHRAADLALLSEDFGLDLVTFQDHPYQGRFHDTWTLLTWVAAKTSTIGIASNVLNLPLRPPAVLARAAASLSLLSGGRFSLGLGAGGFNDAVVAFGGPQRTPGESVTALDEAIDIIRGIWDVDDSSVLRVTGEHYRVDGAKRGPRLPTAVPIWIGAYKPRMQRLIGRKADGWLPSLSWMEAGALAAGNRIIDEAAAAAGRDPSEIVRLLNVNPDTPIDLLVHAATVGGVSTFIVATDDPVALREFAQVVAPEVRERVAAERESAPENAAPDAPGPARTPPPGPASAG